MFWPVDWDFKTNLYVDFSLVFVGVLMMWLDWGGALERVQIVF